jgi:hypothetical protein
MIDLLEGDPELSRALVEGFVYGPTVASPLSADQLMLGAVFGPRAVEAVMTDMEENFDGS